MKRLRYMRHFDYDRKTGYVLQTELDRAQERAIPNGYTDIFYGPLYRTLQTALTVVAALSVKTRIHETIVEIGDGPVIDKALDILKSMDKGEKPLYSPWEYVEPLRKIFGLIMSETGHGLAVGNGPMIELAALGLGRKIDVVPKGEHIDFIQDELGKISVVIP